MSSFISTKTCACRQIPTLYKNERYSRYGQSYKSKYSYTIKRADIKNIDGVLFVNTHNTLISV